MIKAEKTTTRNRINLVNTEKSSGDDAHYIRQISKEEAIYLVRSLLSILLPIKKEDKI